jgi:hypothetical protein
MVIVKKISPFNENFDQNLSCQKLKKGSRAAKINWRATVWPCLVYLERNYQLVCVVLNDCPEQTVCIQQLEQEGATYGPRGPIFVALK